MEAQRLRDNFDLFKNEKDEAKIAGCIAHTEKCLDMFKHPNPYVIPWEKGGCMWDRNPPLPYEVTQIYESQEEMDYRLRR